MSETSQPMPELSTLDLLRLAIRSKFRILLGIVIGSILGVVVSLAISPSYRSTATLLSAADPSALSDFSAASLFKKAGATSPELDLFRNLLTSNAVFNEFLKTPIEVGDSVAIAAVWFVIDTGSQKKVHASIKRLQSDIHVEFDEKTMSGILTVSLPAARPEIAQASLAKLIELTQARMEAVRTSRWKMQIRSFDSASQIARLDWKNTYGRLVQFDEANRSILLPRHRQERAALELDLRIVEQRILEVRGGLEHLTLQEQKSSSPVVVIESPDLPAVKTSPSRMKITGGFGILGALLTFTILLWKDLRSKGWLQL